MELMHKLKMQGQTVLLQKREYPEEVKQQPNISEYLISIL